MVVGRYKGSEYLKSMLLHPKLFPQYSCKNQPLYVKEIHRNNNRKLTFIDPKVPEVSSSRSRHSGGYVNGPAMFSVTDSLLVEPLSSIWTIDLLTELNVPITDLDERFIDVGKEEALCILMASLISNMALNVGLNSMLKKIKQEV